MKAELLAEVKAYVFAAYIGQKAMRWHHTNEGSDPEFTENVTGSMIEAYAHECYLHLKPLSQITGKQSETVTNLQGYVYNGDEIYFNSIGGALMVKYYKEGGAESVNSLSVDYLRQQSFATPIYYRGTTYTIPHLIEMGVIKLKGE